MFYLETLSTFVRHKIILNVFNQKRIIKKISYFPDLFFFSKPNISSFFNALCLGRSGVRITHTSSCYEVITSIK